MTGWSAEVKDAGREEGEEGGKDGGRTRERYDMGKEWRAVDE